MPAAPALYDPAEHRELIGRPWSEAAARASVERIAADAVAAYAGPERLWPNDAADLEGDPDQPYRTAYLGAAGVAWALHVLAFDGLAPAMPGLGELAGALPDGYAAAPEFTEMSGIGGVMPPPSLLLGETGVRLVAEVILGDGGQLDDLHRLVVANTENPTTEVCWGSPGTLAAALELWRRTGEERWRAAWRDGADWLLSRWTEPIWVQDLYDQRSRYVGAGHGFAGTAGCLLAGAELLDDPTAARLTARTAAVCAELALEQDALAQWPARLDRVGRRPRPVQWCHGAPGVVSSLARLPRDELTDRLLDAGGELTWRAGPLRKGPGLCHGAAGNGFALLALYVRTGEERWLDRARAFAMDAAEDVERRRAATGRGRYTLWTGDLGVALYLRACLQIDPRFPFLDGALAMAAAPDDGV